MNKAGPRRVIHGRARAGRLKSVGMLVIVSLLLSACQVLERIRPADERAGGPPATEPVTDPSGERGASSALPPATLQQVINDLDAGRLDQAETALLSIIDRQPDSRLALRFLEQLQSDPIELMGDEYDEVTVQPGESLSLIAERELGDALQFFALARYNAITAPRRMSSGIEIRIPRSLKAAEPPSVRLPAEPVAEQPDPPDRAQAPAAPGAGLTLAGSRLLQSGRTQQSLSLLLAGARAGNLDLEGEQVLIQAALVRSDQLVAEGQLARAVGLLDEVQAQLSPANRLQLAPGRDRIEARRLMAEGVQERRSGRLEQAMALFEQAMALDPDHQELRSETRQLREILVAQLHEQALIQYRDQQLDRAIILWQQVTELDPDFEPAQAYLERSRALKERLSELE